MRAVKTGISTLISLSLSGVMCSMALATEFGTAEEAEAMLKRAVATIQEDKEQALSDFTAGAEGFKEKDLYVFCGDEIGHFVAHGSNKDLIGMSLLEFQDDNGKRFGGEMYGFAMEGEFYEVHYLWPRPGESESSEKVSLVTKIEDLVCGVGYYP